MRSKNDPPRRTSKSPDAPYGDASAFFTDAGTDFRSLKREDGMPIWEALYHFIRPESAETLYRLHAMGFDDEALLEEISDETDRRQFRSNNHIYRRVLKDLSDDLWRMLRSGEISAKGISSSNFLEAPKWITPEHWEHLDINAEKSEAVGPLVTIVNIRIFPKKQNVAEKPPRARISSKTLHKFLAARYKEAERKGVRYNRDEDYRAAKEEYGEKVTYVEVRSARAELVPDDWKAHRNLPRGKRTS